MLSTYNIKDLSRKRRVCAKLMLDKGHGIEFVRDFLNMKPEEMQFVHNVISKQSIIYKSINARILTRWQLEFKE